jgi:hypothetical protein
MTALTVGPKVHTGPYAGKFASVPSFVPGVNDSKPMSEDQALDYWQKEIDAGKWPIYNSGDILNKRSADIHTIMDVDTEGYVPPSAGKTLGTMPVNPRWGDARARHPNRLIHVADALGSAQDFGNKAQIPYLGGVGDLLLGGAQDVTERLAYGDRITTGRGQTQQLHPGTVDLASLAYLPGKAVTGSIGLGAALAAGFTKNILAGGRRRGAVDLGRRSALKNIGTAAVVAPVLATGAKVVDETLTPLVKATVAPVATKDGLSLSKAADLLVGEWNAHSNRYLKQAPPLRRQSERAAQRMAMEADLEEIFARYPGAVLDNATLARFNIRGAQRRSKMFKRNPDYNAYEDMGLKSGSRGEFLHERPLLSAAQSRNQQAAREFLDKLEQAEAQALVERWQVTGKWGTHTPDGTRIPDGVDMDYFDLNDWMQRYNHSYNLPHEDALAIARFANAIR